MAAAAAVAAPAEFSFSPSLPEEPVVATASVVVVVSVVEGETVLAFLRFLSMAAEGGNRAKISFLRRLQRLTAEIWARLTGTDRILHSADNLLALLDVFRIFQPALLTACSAADSPRRGLRSFRPRATTARLGRGRGRSARVRGIDAGLTLEALDFLVEEVEAFLLGLRFGGETVRFCLQKLGESARDGMSVSGNHALARLDQGRDWERKLTFVPPSWC